MSPAPNPRTALLREAESLVNGDRNDSYGPPAHDFEVTAKLWSAYLGVPITAGDVCGLMVLLKVRRLKITPNHRDSLVDIAGYAACWADVVAG